MAFMLWLATLAQLALAQADPGGLSGRKVILTVQSWDDPAQPLLISSDYTGTVGPGAEFQLRREAGNGLGVVPVTVDIADARIDISFPQGTPSAFSLLKFNGYVLQFLSECTLFRRAQIDPATTTLPLTDANIIMEPQRLMVNVAGLSFGSTDHIGITLEVADCPLS